MVRMDTTVRNLDDDAYRLLKARAAVEGRNVGEVLSDAIREYVANDAPGTKRGSLADVAPIGYPKGNERLSEDIDAVVYGVDD